MIDVYALVQMLEQYDPDVIVCVYDNEVDAYVPITAVRYDDNAVVIEAVITYTR